MRTCPDLTGTVLLGLALFVPVAAAQHPERPRLRELGIAAGILEPGPLNAITDVGDGGFLARRLHTRAQ